MNTIPIQPVFTLILTLCIIGVSKIYGGNLWKFFLVPCTLLWIHTIGNTLQELQLGPKWVQNHLHNLGVANLTIGCAIVHAIIKVRWNPNYEKSYKLEVYLPWCTIWYHLAGTAICILEELRQITIAREEYIARGYSGNLDIGDMIAYGLGFIIMLINHFSLRNKIRVE
mgnify:CR=1 FL=1